MFGVDLASVDDPGQPHWDTSKMNGFSFVFLRAAWGAAPDVFYGPQISFLKALDLPYGPYLFLRFPFRGGTPAQPELQVQALIKTAGNLSPFPPVLDIEFPGNGFSETGLTHEQGLNWIRRAWKALKDHYGVAPIIYTSARVWIEDLGDPKTPDLVESPLWLARYALAARQLCQLTTNSPSPPVPSPWGTTSDTDNWWIHQYQGDALGVPGFGCAVDLNRFNYMKIGAKGLRVKWVQKRLGL